VFGSFPYEEEKEGSNSEDEGLKKFYELDFFVSKRFKNRWELNADTYREKQSSEEWDGRKWVRIKVKKTDSHQTI
jgi:hypothetical protein